MRHCDSNTSKSCGLVHEFEVGHGSEGLAWLGEERIPVGLVVLAISSWSVVSLTLASYSVFYFLCGHVDPLRFLRDKIGRF
jgi:hypothetical protein